MDNSNVHLKNIVTGIRSVVFFLGFLTIFVVSGVLTGFEKLPITYLKMLLGIMIGMIVGITMGALWNAFAKRFLHGKYMFSLDHPSPKEETKEDTTHENDLLCSTVHSYCDLEKQNENARNAK